MGYNLRQLTEELVAKKLADDGLVGWGQNSNSGIIGAITGGMFTISCSGDKIVIIPFNNNEIRFAEKVTFSKSQIKQAKISGIFGASLKLEMNDGRVLKFPIMQGKTAVQEIIAKLFK